MDIYSYSSELHHRYGISIDDVSHRFYKYNRDRRKNIYVVIYPDFSSEQTPGEIPKGWIESNEFYYASDARKFVNKLLKDKNFVFMCEEWIRQH